jgi:ADP-ribosylglycohydrolase
VNVTKNEPPCRIFPFALAAAMNLPTVNQYAGCLVGQCLASALAQSVNDQTGEACTAFSTNVLEKWWRCRDLPSPTTPPIAEFVRFDPANSPPRHGGDVLEPAAPAVLQYAEGAQLAVVIVDSVVASGGFFPADLAARIAKLAAERRIVGQLWETYKTSKNIREGAPWQEAGIDSTGTSAAQRAGPVGLMFCHAPPLRLRVAAQQAMITNRNITAIAGAVVVAEAAAQLADGQLGGQALVAHLAQNIAEIDSEFSRALLQFNDWLNLAPQAALAQIRLTAPGDPFANAPEGIQSHVIPVVLWSLYSVLRSEGDFLQSLKLALAPGGNVSATATIAGACSGVQVGLDALPGALCARLANGDVSALAGLRDLSRLLHELMGRALLASPNSHG